MFDLLFTQSNVTRKATETISFKMLIRLRNEIGISKFGI